MENKVNYNAIQEYVSTQNGDLIGIIQIDGNENIESIYQLCKDYKFKTEDKFIVGFGLEESTPKGIGYKDEVYCSILYVLKKEYGENFDEIKSKIESSSKTLKLHKKDFLIKYSELSKYIRRFNFITITRIAENAKSIEIINDEEL